MSSDDFSGLSMPVFTAFGWAGEENAIQFALSQLELFIEALYFRSLPREIQAHFPAHGLDKKSQSVYLATTDEPEKGLIVSFLARPMSLEINLSIEDKKALTTAYRFAEKQPEALHGLLTDLGARWNLRVQQMEYDRESGEATHYNDLYKDSLDKMDESELMELIARASFYNGEEKWVTPISLGKRINSEKVAAMGTTVLSLVVEELQALLPLISFLTGVKPKRPAAAQPAKPRPPKKRTVDETSRKELVDAADLEEFTYVSELKPLHIRRGFINLTSNHWPFFALNARTEVRKVMLDYNDKQDKGCSVWRLVPNDQARLVLSPAVREWLDDNFEPSDEIEIKATKEDSKKITITLRPVYL